MVLETNWMGTGCVRNGEACGWIWRDLAPKPYGLSKALGASNLRHINISSILIGLIHWTSILEPYLGWWSASIFQMDWSHLSGFVSNGIFVLTGKVMINQRNVVPCFQNPIIICYVYIHNIRTRYENMIIYIYTIYRCAAGFGLFLHHTDNLELVSTKRAKTPNETKCIVYGWVYIQIQRPGWL